MPSSVREKCLPFKSMALRKENISEIHFSSCGALVAGGWAQEKKDNEGSLHDDGAQKKVSKNQFYVGHFCGG
jgi:hypothetical protein